jgi:hypothetical protein
MAKVKGGMSAITILIVVLSVIILFWVLYYVYMTFFSGSNTLNSSPINLNTANPLPILATTLTNPTSTKYAYGIWIYVNSWDTTKYKVIFSRYNDILLYLDQTTGVLKCAINSGTDPSFYMTPPSADGVMDPANLQPSFTSGNSMITVTNNFPLQTWVYVVVNVNNNTADIYLNGQMTKSLQIKQVSPDKTSNIYYGSGYDAVVSGFTRWSTNLDPNTVWSTYTNGSNSKSLSGVLGGGYHASVTISKNNTTSSEFNIF